MNELTIHVQGYSWTVFKFLTIVLITLNSYKAYRKEK